VGFDVIGSGNVDDPGAGVFLRRYGAQKECAQYPDAMFYCLVLVKRAVGIIRLQYFFCSQ
jgi:hypothetical protein